MPTVDAEAAFIGPVCAVARGYVRVHEKRAQAVRDPQFPERHHQ